MGDFFFDGIDISSSIDEMPSEGTQKTLHMIFIVDNSGSMRNEQRMDSVNRAFQTMIPDLQKIQRDVGSEYTILLSIMAFNEDPEWMAEVEEINYYVHTDIPASEYVTYFSRAFDELNAKMSRSGFFRQKGKMAAPYIMFMTDGAPTEGDDYESALSRLYNNGWFVNSQKYAVLIGQDTVNDPIAKQAVMGFAGNEEGILGVVDAEDLVKQVSAKTIHVVEQMTQLKRDLQGSDLDSNLDSNPQGSPVDFPEEGEVEFDDPTGLPGDDVLKNFTF